MKRLKRITLFLLVMILSAISFQKASAAETNLPDGFLIGEENGISVSKDGGYFFNLDDLRPGDHFKRKLIIKNFRDEAYDLKLVIEPKSKTGKIDLIENMSMQILLEDQEVYQGNLSTNKDGSKEVSFGLIEARSEKTVMIDLTMNDVEKWNQLYFSGPSEAEVEWQFIATYSEKPAEENKELPKSAGNPPQATPGAYSSGSTGKGFLPQTGEALMEKAILIGIFLVAVVWFIAVKRRRSEYR